MTASSCRISDQCNQQEYRNDNQQHDSHDGEDNLSLGRPNYRSIGIKIELGITLATCGAAFQSNPRVVKFLDHCPTGTCFLGEDLLKPIRITKLAAHGANDLEFPTLR